LLARAGWIVDPVATKLQALGDASEGGVSDASMGP
jgi:hypothetical protein